MEKIDFVIFIIIYMMVVGIVSSIFNPEMYSFGEEDYVSPEIQEQVRNDNWWDGIVNAITGIATALGNIISFLWAGLTLNIPEVPLVVRVVMCSPMWGAMGYTIVTLIPGVGGG